MSSLSRLVSVSPDPVFRYGSNGPAEASDGRSGTIYRWVRGLTTAASYAVSCRADSRLVLRFMSPASRNAARYFVGCSSTHSSNDVYASQPHDTVADRLWSKQKGVKHHGARVMEGIGRAMRLGISLAHRQATRGVTTWRVPGALESVSVCGSGRRSIRRWNTGFREATVIPDALQKRSENRLDRGIAPET